METGKYLVKKHKFNIIIPGQLSSIFIKSNLVKIFGFFNYHE